MLKKHVNLCIYSENLPFQVKIYSQNGMLLIQKNVNSNYIKISTSTYFCKLLIFAKHNNITQRKIICLSNNMCQNIYVGFKFFKQTILPNPSEQKIILYDANYNFLLPTAVLEFKQKTPR